MCQQALAKYFTIFTSLLNGLGKWVFLSEGHGWGDLHLNSFQINNFFVVLSVIF